MELEHPDGRTTRRSLGIAEIVHPDAHQPEAGALWDLVVALGRRGVGDPRQPDHHHQH